MPTVRVAFRYGDKRLFSRIVCLLRGGDSAHCEVAASWQGDAHECVSSSWVDGGVRVKWINLDRSKWRVYEIEAVKHPADWAKAHAGQRYDALGLLAVLLPPLRGWSKAWLCSEVAADVIGLREPVRFDPAPLESVVGRYGRAA